MAFPNISDLVATTLENRSKKIADNVTKNNAVYDRLAKKGKIKPVSGGTLIYQELSYAENPNFQWYSGYDTLATGAADVISAAQYNWKQAAVGVVVSGLEMMINSGKEALLDLVESRIAVAESTMANQMASALYGDGTTFGGKIIGGLNYLAPTNPATGTVGGIDRSTWTFWRSQYTALGTAVTSGNVQGFFNTAWQKQVRGKDRPDLAIVDGVIWSAYTASLQNIVRLTNGAAGQLGWPSVQYMDMDVVLDGGIGGYAPASTGWFLNTDYVFLRPHAQRNMVPIKPSSRVAINQDAEVTILGWMGNMTASNCAVGLGKIYGA